MARKLWGKALPAELRRIRLDPGDVLVVTLADQMPQAQMQEIKTLVEGVFSDNKVLIKTGSVEFSVYGPDAA